MRLASPLSNTTHYREFFFFFFKKDSAGFCDSEWVALFALPNAHNLSECHSPYVEEGP